MSFLIAVYVNEGIVLASDRRTTYTNTQNIGGQIIQRIGIHTTNTTDKTFICPNGVGISTCGDATLLGKPITGHIQEMIREKIDENCKIKDIPNIVIEYFNKLPEIPNTNFIVAGYENFEYGRRQKIYKFNVKSKHVEVIDTSFQGAIWDGETYTLSRLVKLH